MKLHLKAPAKINLALDILGFDGASGYHKVETVIYKLSNMADELTLERSDRFELTFEGHEIPPGQDNLIWMALDLLGDTKWKVHVVKNISTQAGLGGGSSDAASVLKAIGPLRGISNKALSEMARQLGCDVPFFLAEGNYVYCVGRGDEVVGSWRGPDLRVELFDTGQRVLTRMAYSQLDLLTCGQRRRQTHELADLLEGGSFDRISECIHNDFETSFFMLHPELAGKGHLCGSGGWMWRFVEG